MTTDEKGLTTSEKENRIAPWGNREELREIARRVQLMSPGGKKLDENQALALAQGAVAHGLDPFNGEIWFIPGAGLMAGIKGLRKAARNQIEGNYWTEFEELKNPDERSLLAIPDGALAFRCIIRDSETLRTYTNAWAEMREKGIPADLIPQVLGKRPYVEGIGYFKHGESSKMDPVQVAMKRAEADALKRRFDLPFAVPSEPNDAFIDAEWKVEETAKDAAALWPETVVKAGETTNKPGRPFSPESLRIRLQADSKKLPVTAEASPERRGLMVGMLEEAFADKDATKKRHSVIRFLWGDKSSSAEMGGREVIATLDWLKPSKDSGGAYHVADVVLSEIRAVLKAALLEAGQTELPV